MSGLINNGDLKCPIMAHRAPRIELGSNEHMTLESIVRTSAQRDVLRPRNASLAAEGQRNEQIQAALDLFKPVIIKRRRRFSAQRFEGLVDALGRGLKRKYDAVVRHRITATARNPTDSVGAHWSVRTLRTTSA